MGLPVKESAGAAHSVALAGAKWIEFRWSTRPAHPFLMLTGLHGPDVISPLKRSCLPKSGSTRKRPCFHNWRPYGCESGISRHRAERTRSAGYATSRLPVVLRLALRKNASRARNDNHGNSIILVGRRAFRQARSVAPLAAWPSQIWEFPVRHHRGD